jgi:hypothetical protein
VATRSAPLVSAELRARLESPEVQRARAAAFEAVWDLVWHRRIAYFITVGFTLLLVTMPLWVARVSNGGILADGRTWIDAPVRAIGAFLPAMFQGWIDTLAANPFYAFLVAACIAVSMRHGLTQERTLRDLARRRWREAIDGTLPAPGPASRLTQFRTSGVYQRTVQTFKWRLLPDAVLLPVILLIGLWLGAAGATQAYLPWLEGGTALCASAGPTLPPLTSTPYMAAFTTSTTCHPVGHRVERGKRYRVEMRVAPGDPWFDGTHPTDPKGLRARDLGVAGIIGGPFRRVIEANFLQPVIEIRQPPHWWPFDHAYIAPLALEERERHLFVGEFEAAAGGELFLFANDAVSPFDPAYFYTSRLGRNHGTALLMIALLDQAPVSAAVPQSDAQARAD